MCSEKWTPENGGFQYILMLKNSCHIFSAIFVKSSRDRNKTKSRSGPVLTPVYIYFIRVNIMVGHVHVIVMILRHHSDFGNVFQFGVLIECVQK